MIASGCSGTVIFAWTDEWFRGGFQIEDWDFGLVRRDRHPKRALAAVREAYRHVPFAPDIVWPRMSVVVCSFNGEATIRDTLDGLASIDYPDCEIIVIDDGSTDSTAEIAAEYDGKLKVCKVDVDANPEIPPKFGIRGIPTLIVFKGGNAEATKVGALSKTQLTEFVQEVIS